MRIVTYLIEYLGEFEFIFENILDNESGEQMGSFDEKKPPSKISSLGTFKTGSDCIVNFSTKWGLFSFMFLGRPAVFYIKRYITFYKTEMKLAFYLIYLTEVIFACFAASRNGPF
jgi:hypothetical protein